MKRTTATARTKMAAARSWLGCSRDDALQRSPIQTWVLSVGMQEIDDSPDAHSRLVPSSVTVFCKKNIQVILFENNVKELSK